MNNIISIFSLDKPNIGFPQDEIANNKYKTYPLSIRMYLIQRSDL